MKRLGKWVFRGLVVCLTSVLAAMPITYAQDDAIVIPNIDGKKLSLSECIDIAMKKSPVMQEAKEEIEISRARLAEARSGYMPQITARASYSYFNTNNVIKTRLPDDLMETLSENAVMEGLRKQALVSGVNPISGSAITELDVLNALAVSSGTTPANMFGVLKGTAQQTMLARGNDILWSPILGNNVFNTQVSLQQPIFLWGKVYSLNKQAKAGIGASKSELTKVRHDVKMEIIERYQQIILAKDGLKLGYETEQKFSTLRDLIKRLYNAGAEKVMKIDYLEADAMLGLVKAKVYEVEKGLALAKAALRQSMGLDDKVEIDIIDDTLTYEFVDANLQESLQKALQNRPEFQKLEFGITAKVNEIKATKADNRPKVVVDSAFDVTVDNKDYLEPDPVDFRLSVIAEVPLFDGLRTRARVNQRKHELNKLHEIKKELTNGVTLEVINAYLTLEESRKKLVATEEATASAVENQSLARKSFEMELIEAKKVIDAQVLEAEVKAQRLLSIFNYNVAKAKLKKVVGEIDSVASSNDRQFEIVDIKAPSK